MQISRSAYYNWLKRDSDLPDKTEEVLKDKIRAIFKKSRNTYGTRRMVKALKEAGIEIGRYKVRRLMEELGLEARYPKEI